MKVDLALAAFDQSPADIRIVDQLSSQNQIHNNTLTPPATKETADTSK